MKIVKLDPPIYLKEGIPVITDVLAYSDAYEKANDANEQSNIFKDFISKIDPDNLTLGFRNIMISLLGDGVSSNHPFLVFLKNSKDENIKALDESSAQTLKDLLEDKKLDPNSKYLTEINELFSGESSDISYKLNAVSMLLDPTVADNYKNSKGETPSIDLVYKDGKFLSPTLKFKRALDDFTSTADSTKKITLQIWARTKGKAPKGKELEELKKQLQKYLDGITDPVKEDIPSRILNSISERVPGTDQINKLYDKSLSDRLLSWDIDDPDSKNSWEDIINYLIEEYKKNKFESKQLLTTIATSIMNYLPNTWKTKNLYNYSNLSTILKKYILSNMSDREKNEYFPKLSILQNSDDVAKYLGTQLKDNALKTIINATKTFLSKY